MPRSDDVFHHVFCQAALCVFFAFAIFFWCRVNLTWYSPSFSLSVTLSRMSRAWPLPAWTTSDGTHPCTPPTSCPSASPYGNQVLPLQAGPRRGPIPHRTLARPLERLVRFPDSQLRELFATGTPDPCRCPALAQSHVRSFRPLRAYRPPVSLNSRLYFLFAGMIMSCGDRARRSDRPPRYDWPSGSY